MTTDGASSVIAVVPQPLLAASAEGVVTLANPRARAVFGRDLVGEPLAAIFADDAAVLADLLARCRRVSKPFPARLTLTDEDGPRACAVRVQRLGSAETFDGMSLLLSDEPEQRFRALTGTVAELQAEVAQRRRAETALRRAVERNDLLLRELRHRVQNNVALMQGLIRQQLRTTGNTDTRNALQDLSGRLAAVFTAQRHVLDEEHKSRIPVRSIIEPVADGVLNLRDGGAALTMEIDDNFTVRGDQANALALILNELMTNSVKHSGRPDLQLTVRARCDGNRRWVMIRDNGTGFPVVSGPASGLGGRLVDGLCAQLGATATRRTEAGAIVELSWLGMTG